MISPPITQVVAPLLVWRDIVASLLYSGIGIAVFCVTFLVVDKLTPYDLWREIVEKQNRALALVVAGIGLGICLIIAAAIH
jgi:putative membrane protein